jgi:hypothetical protein
LKCMKQAVLSILAATSMPVGNAGAQTAPANAGKQPALPAGAEVAASESSTPDSQPAETNFQQAFSLALRGSVIPAAKIKPTPSGAMPQPATDASAAQKTATETNSGASVAAQNLVNGNQIIGPTDRLISNILSLTPPSTIVDDSKAPASTVPLAPKEQSPSKSKMAPQSGPADPKVTQSSGDNQTSALITSVAAALIATAPQPQITASVSVSNRVPAPADPMPAPPASAIGDLPRPSVRDLPAPPVSGVQTAPVNTNVAAEPALPAMHTVQSEAPPVDSLSFALLLHPKSAQAPITTTQSVSVVKQLSDSRNAPLKTSPAISAQIPDTAANDNKVSTVAVPAGNSSGEPLQSDRSAPVAAIPAQTHDSPQSVVTPSQQQSSPATVFQTHTPQNSSPSDQPTRGKTQLTSDDNSSVIAGLSDTTKPIVTATNLIPNAPAVHGKPSETVSGTPVLAQVVNAQNQAPGPAAKEVVIRLQGQTGEAISVRLVDQGGQVQVAVRSSDPATANLLRQDLSSLTNNLDRAGWKPEVLPSTPIPTSFVRETSQGSPNDGQNSQGHAQGALDWNQQDSSRRRSTVADLWDEILTRQGT